MERAPSSAPNKRAQQEALDAALEDSLDNDPESSLLAPAERDFDDTIDDTLDDDPDYADLHKIDEGPGITYDAAKGPWNTPEAWSNERKTQDQMDSENARITGDITPAEMQAMQQRIQKEEEANIKLRGSQRLDKRVHEWADETMQGGEKIAANVGDKKFKLKDGYLQFRVNGAQSKKDRYERLAQTAPTKSLRRKYAGKARGMDRRLKYYKGIRDMGRSEYDKDTAGAGVEGSRLAIRKARAEQLQYKIHRMIAAEYKFAKLGREERKNKVSGERDPKKREALRRELLDDTSTVDKLEALGKQAFLRKLVAAKMVNAAAIFAANQFEAALANGHN